MVSPFILSMCEKWSNWPSAPLWINTWSQVSVNKRRSVSVWKAAGRLCFCCWKERESNHCITATLNCTLQCVSLSKFYCAKLCSHTTMNCTWHTVPKPTLCCALLCIVYCPLHIGQCNMRKNFVCNTTFYCTGVHHTLCCVVCSADCVSNAVCNEQPSISN